MTGGQVRGTVDELLTESFKELAKSQPIEKITIREITEKAGVIRPTFYNHFQDKYELLERIICTELIGPIRPLVENGLVHEGLVLLFTNMEKDREFYIRASRLEGQNSFESIAQECVERLLLTEINSRAQGKPLKYAWLTPEWIARYYAHTMCFVAVSWLRMGMTVSAREMAEIYRYIIERSLDEVLSEL